MKGFKRTSCGWSKLPALVLALTASVALAGVWPAVSAAPTYHDPEGYKVLSLMLDKEAETWKEHNLDVMNLRINNRSTVVFECSSVPEEFRAAAEELAKIPDRHFRFARKFTLDYPYSLNEGAEIMITAVGFDAARTHAVADISRGCGGMCSGGHTYLFRKSNQAWEIVDRVCETMS